MNSLKNLKESMGCNTIRDDHGGGVIYQRVHMDKDAFDEMLAEVEEEYSYLQAENTKLRDYAYALEECRRAVYYCAICPHYNFNFEDEEPQCDFDFAALRSAAGMEVDE